MLLGVIAVSSIVMPQVAQAQSSQSKAAYKERFDELTAYADENCVMQKRRVQNLTYEICRMEDVVMKVTMDGPEGDNGPTAYFDGGRLHSFRDTGLGEAWIFQDGKLMAEVEVGTVAPERNKITTKFSPAMRREITTRATSSTKGMLKVFGETLRL
jgi:hypothetical protein